MAKSSFINKKALTIIAAIIAVVAVGVGLYFLLKPKVDLLAPYNNMFEVKTSTNYEKVQEYHEKLTNHLNNYYNTATNDAEKAPIKHTLDVYSHLTIMQNSLFSIDDMLLSNLAFTNDKDGKMVNIQREMTKSYETITGILEECVTYINDYLVDNKITNLTSAQLFRYIQNYNTTYYKYVDELANFYTLASEIFANYTVNTFNVNPITKYCVKTIAYWANNSANKLANWKEEYTMADISTSLTNLSEFVTTTYNDAVTTGYYKNQVAYDTLLKNFNGVDFYACVENVANNSFATYVSSQTDAQLKTQLTELGNSFFQISVIGG